MTTAQDIARQQELLRRARGRAAGPRTRPEAAGNGPAPLSHAQHRMWLMERLGHAGALYNVPFATRLRGPFDAEAFGLALTGLVRRHEVLRTRYPHTDGEPYQEVTPAAPVPVRTVEAPAGTEETRRLLHEEAARPFDLATGPVLRALLVRHAPDDHTALLTFHHIAMDGGSLELVADELTSRYRAALDGLSGDPAHEAPRYAEFARRERSATADPGGAGLAYWTERLAGARPLALPAPRPGGSRGTGRLLTAPLPPGTADGLRSVGRSHRATLFTVVLAAAFATLLEATGEEDLVIGCASSHRDRAEARGLVGLCVNTLAVRPDLSGAADFPDLLGRVRDEVLRAQQYRHVPFDAVVERLGAAARDEAGNPLVGVTADVPGRPVVLDLGGTAAEAVEIPLGTAKFGLGFFLEEASGEAPERCVVQYDTGRLSGETARELLSAFTELLTTVATTPGARPLVRGTPVGAPARPDAPAPRAAAASVRAVEAVFADLLGERPGPDGDFFLLGGHSLLAVRVAERLRERFGAPFTGLDVLEHRTPRAIAAVLEERTRQRAARHPSRAGGAVRTGTTLVTGGTGGVGAFVLRELAARGRPVRALVRPESAHLVPDGVDAELVEGDLADPESLRAAAEGVDAVVHAACTFTSPEVDVAAMRALLSARREGPFVFVSSVDAYGMPSVADVAEEAPSEEPLSSYGRAKLECERMLMAAAGPRGGASVVRAPIVWGAHPRLRDQLRWGATGALYQAARAGEPVVLPPAGAVPPSGDAWSGAPWVHAAALARAVAHCAERPVDGVVNAVGGHVAWSEWAGELVRLLGSPSAVVPSPESGPGLLHRHRYRTEALAEHLAGRPGEDWRPVLAEMLRG
ncbi:NAD-dependent epimerase/dehydratase family protein [Streptomyces sp. AV19]|uniref:condensation domain-containing protein n=1 Tax=Streptomyces sp. AV19 TaxID=2793068 RepID=UPI0018FE3FAF|nr:condensation domain-containing protein [Streptomyces sp. AV19]MBH1938731.1 NAD-dependent epimerase/dehydratase family protein [Streptomyces sp. AV19]MDG4533992.1 condensation domain-containing protein [Streptomyces sp. AV19]